MFLVDSAQAPDWDAVVKTVKAILKRSDVEIVSMRNWAERKLAYEINHKSRGAYALCYFRAECDKIRNIEKDVQLSEQIMRVLILSAETREKEALEEDTATSDSHPGEGGDSPAPAKATPDRDVQAQDKTAEIKSSRKEDQIETQEDITEELSEDQQQIEKQAPEKTDALQDSDETDEPEKTGALQDSDETDEPEKPTESAEADASEPEQTEQSETEKDTTEKDASD